MFDLMFQYDPSALIPDVMTQVEFYADGCQFLTALSKMNPNHVVLFEPQLHLMRALEVHSAERLQQGINTDLEVLLIRY